MKAVLCAGLLTCAWGARQPFDFVVGPDGDFKQALAAASKRSSPAVRFRIFLPNGEYDLGSLTGDGNQKTTVTASQLSLIGQDADSTLLFNHSRQEGIHLTSTLHLKGNDLYLQDLTLRNKAPYDADAPASRYVALTEEGDRFIYKRVRLMSGQDTYYTMGSTRTYWEDGRIHGNADFICGQGDIFFNRCLLYLEKGRGWYIAAPATIGTWGYVFRDCTIDGLAGNGYSLGRPWSNAPKAVYIGTTMKILPSPAGWGDPMNVNPSRFAEYGSRDASGSLVDLSRRRTTYTRDGKTVQLNPVLTPAQAAEYSVANVLRGSDGWQPEKDVLQVNAPAVRRDGSILVWDDNPDALCWMVFKEGRFTRCVTAPRHELPAGDPSVYTVRAANAMGGLGPGGREGEGASAIRLRAAKPLSEGETHRFDVKGREVHTRGFAAGTTAKTQPAFRVPTTLQP